MQIILHYRGGVNYFPNSASYKKTKNPLGDKIMNHFFTSVLLTIFVLLSSCMKPVNITIPDGMERFQAMPITGAKDSWKLNFGGIHIDKIKDIDSRILLVDSKYSLYHIKSFEFTMKTIDNTQHQCYCEFPLSLMEDKTISCTFQDVNNQLETGQLIDGVISSSFGDISVEEYFEYDDKESDSKDVLIGYLFKDSGKNVGLVDIANRYNETVWIDPSIDLQKQVLIAAGSTSFILKHRKWYEKHN